MSEQREVVLGPVSEVEGLFGVRMSKGQKWAWVIGITLAIYGVTYYVNKK